MFKDVILFQIERDFGYTQKQALDYYNRIDNDTRKEFEKEYYEEARKSFYED